MFSHLFEAGAHGHSHGVGAECGHSHSGISDEMRKAMLQQFEDNMMAFNQGSRTRSGRVLYDQNDPGPGLYNNWLFGYGHEGSSMPAGWDALIPSKPSDDSGRLALQISGDEMMPAYRDRVWLINVPILGRMRVVKDCNGFIQAFGVVLYWLYGNWSTWTAILLPYYADGAISLPLILLYSAISILCITSFIRSSTLNPGSLNANETPQDDWTECKVCQVFRPPLSHHCRRCGQCVRRMDHHCPWINNCVGEENQFAFMLLLLYAFLLSFVTLIIHYIYFFQLDACLTCQRDSFVIQNQNVIIYICLAMAILMLLFSMTLLCQLHFGVVIDTPTVERMKRDYEIHINGVSPNELYNSNKSVHESYVNLCGRQPWWCLLLPCRRR